MVDFPKKYNPVPVKIRQIRHIDTIIDPVYRTPLDKDINEAILSVQCQVEYKRRDKQESTMTGDQDDSAGQLVFKIKYYNQNNLNILKGDLIIHIQNRPVSYRIIEVRESAFLRGKPHLIICRFIEDPRQKNSI